MDFLARLLGVAVVSFGLRTRFLVGVGVAATLRVVSSGFAESSSALGAETGAFLGARFLGAGLVVGVVMGVLLVGSPLMASLASVAVAASGAKSSMVSSSWAASSS